MIVSHFGNSVFILIDGSVHLSIEPGPLIQASSLDSLLLFLVETLDLGQLLLRRSVVLLDEVLDLLFLLIELSLQLTLSLSELLLRSLVLLGSSRVQVLELRFGLIFTLVGFDEILLNLIQLLLCLSTVDLLFKFHLVAFLLQGLKIVLESGSRLGVLLFDGLSLVNEFLFDTVDSLLELFSANDRLAVLALKALQQGVVSNSVLLKLLLLLFELELCELKPLLKHGLFLGPVLLSHFERLFGLLEGILKLKQPVLVDLDLVLVDTLELIALLIISLFELFVLSRDIIVTIFTLLKLFALVIELVLVFILLFFKLNLKI